MTCRILVAMCAATAVVVLAPVSAAGQAGNWSAPSTPWGDPDLQGFWTNTTTTPLERPDDVAAGDELSDEERASRDTAGDVAREARGIEPGTGETGSYNNFWVERGVRMARASLIIDPPDGKLPLTPAEATRRADREAYRNQAPAGPEDRSAFERCISRGMPGAMMPGFYNHNYQILQAPGYVAIYVEMVHDARIIPLDGRPHVDPQIRQWLGDSRGRWEGDTLVVETVNVTQINQRALGIFGANESARLVERFTRTGEHSIDYELTVTDPAEYARPWTASIPMTTLEGGIYEYACHEGNYGLENILLGARALEAAANQSR